MQAPRSAGLLLLPALYLLAAAAAAPGDSPESATHRLPEQLTDVDGHPVDISSLARERNLVLVTLKEPGCPVCREQLIRLRERLPGLQACGVTFVVLSPGPAEAVRDARAHTGFEFPFVVDRDLALSRSLGLARPGGRVFPCMLQILPDRSIGWTQLGRNGFYFGDAELAKFFDCSRAV